MSVDPNSTWPVEYWGIEPYGHKPFWRGYFHQAAFFMAVGASTMLVAWAPAHRAFYAAIYSFGLCWLFGISALYHRPTWGPRGLRWLRRLDHSGIFLFIATTFTPIAHLGYPGPGGVQMLNLLWAGCAIGIIEAFVWLRSPPWVMSSLCVGVGWIASFYLPELTLHMGAYPTKLLFAGGVLYTIGAVIYATKWPDPFPDHFGYHEIFHFLVVVAALIHFVLIHHLIFHT